MIPLNELRHPVRILRAVTCKPDSRGVRPVRYWKVCDTWAGMKDVGGRAFFEAAAHQMEDVVTFTIRWREGLDRLGPLRIVLGKTAYDVLHINHLGYRRDFLQLKARRVEAVR